MMIETYLLYLAALTVFFLKPPGVSQLLVMSNTMRHGLQKSSATIFGDLTANAMQMTAAAYGLAAIIAISANMIFWIRWAGVAYLVWLALSLVFRKSSNNIQNANETGKPGTLFKQGFLTSSANPYAIVFFGALFPQFIDASQPVWPQLLILGTTYLIVDGILLCVWGWFAVKAASCFRQIGSDWLNRISGMILLFAAGILASKNLEVELPK